MLPLLVTTLLETVVLFGVFGYLYRQRRDVHLGWWALAWLASSCRHGASLLPGAEWSTILEQLFALAQATCVLAGALALSERRLPRPVIALVVAGAAWIPIAHSIDVSFVATTLPTFAFLGITTIAAGIAIARTEKRSVGRWLTAGTLVLWGLHQLDYPFLRPIPEVAPWGYAFAAVAEALTGIGFLVLSNERAIRRERASAEKHRDFIQRLPVGVFEISADGRLQSANDTLLRILGYDALDELRCLDIPDFEDDVLRPTELEWQHRDGESVRVVVQGRSIRDDAGKLSHFEGIARDVTERRRMQEIVARSERMEALGRLAGGVAHDFNNLLTVIRAGTSILRITSTGDERSSRWVEDIDGAAERAVTLTTTLLTVARGGQGKRESVELAATIERLRPMLARIGGDTSELDVRIDSNAEILTEVGSLDRVLLNLVTNARDAGSSRVVIECAEVELGDQEATTLALRPGPHVRLRVRDDGCGMDRETRSRVFEPFFTTRAEGTGLGLSTVYTFVEAAGGRIEVDSAPAKGTTFTIYWPKGRPSQPPLAAEQPTPSIRGERVLVIDDEEAVRSAVVSMLERIGFDVSAASGRAEAAEAAEHHPDIEIVLSDVNLGDDDGIRLAKELEPRLPKASFFFMSGYAKADDATSVKLLTKPFTVEELRRWLASHGVVPGRSSVE